MFVPCVMHHLLLKSNSLSDGPDRNQQESEEFFFETFLHYALSSLFICLFWFPTVTLSKSYSCFTSVSGSYLFPCLWVLKEDCRVFIKHRVLTRFDFILLRLRLPKDIHEGADQLNDSCESWWLPTNCSWSRLRKWGEGRGRGTDGRDQNRKIHKRSWGWQMTPRRVMPLSFYSRKKTPANK